MSNKPVIDELKHVLADSYALLLKTQNYHWNVEGPRFKSLHELFEAHYNDLFPAIDEIAETIRALGEKAPGTWKAYADITTIQDGDESASAEQMATDLANDQATIIRTLETAFDAAEQANDQVVIDLLVGRMAIHRKNKWMLDTILK